MEALTVASLAEERVGALVEEESQAAMVEMAVVVAEFYSERSRLYSRLPTHNVLATQCPPMAPVPSKRWNRDEGRKTMLRARACSWPAKLS